jgi:hypothetical protein
MPNFYVTPEVKEQLTKLSGGDINHPVIDKFCEAYVNEYIRTENKQTIKIVIFCSAFTLIILALLLIGFMSL